MIDTAKEVYIVGTLPTSLIQNCLIEYNDTGLVVITGVTGLLSSLNPLKLTNCPLQLRRPAAFFPEWRLDRLLQKKAQQGVRVYVMVYKEVGTCSFVLTAMRIQGMSGIDVLR